MTSFSGHFAMQLSIFSPILHVYFARTNISMILQKSKKVDGASDLSSWRYRRVPLLPDNPDWHWSEMDQRS